MRLINSICICRPSAAIISGYLPPYGRYAHGRIAGMCAVEPTGWRSCLKRSELRRRLRRKSIHEQQVESDQLVAAIQAQEQLNCGP